MLLSIPQLFLETMRAKQAQRCSEDLSHASILVDKPSQPLTVVSQFYVISSFITKLH
jgi:hypothetical protein